MDNNRKEKLVKKNIVVPEENNAVTMSYCPTCSCSCYCGSDGSDSASSINVNNNISHQSR